MSEYADFPKDFLKRTQENLNNYTGRFEVTNLINSCLGLIIIPNEFMINNLPFYKFLDNESKYGINKSNIRDCISKDYSLKNIVKGIRNGLAHGNIEQKTKNGKICGIKISNINKGKVKLTVEFTNEEFKNFALSLSDDFLQHNKKD